MKAMNKKILLAMALTALTATTVNARSWRINNDATKMAQFTSIKDAINSTDVVDGDTLYLDPATTLSGCNVTKQVTIIGCGYTGVYATISGDIWLFANNIKLLGVYCSNRIYISAQHITIERCSTASICYYSDNNYNCQYATIRNCYIRAGYYIGIAGGGYASNYTNYLKTAEWTIENNIIYGNYGSDKSRSVMCVSDLYQAKIRNNLIINLQNNTSSYSLYRIGGNSEITNNIIIHTTKPAQAMYTIISNYIRNNVLSSNTGPDYNRCNVLTTDSVFTGDYQEYVLTEDSPARGYGQDGKDCGIFGGLYPYVKGGRPYGHPYFEQYSVSSRPENGKVNVSLKIKTQDE